MQATVSIYHGVQSTRGTVGSTQQSLDSVLGYWEHTLGAAGSTNGLYRLQGAHTGLQGARNCLCTAHTEL